MARASTVHDRDQAERIVTAARRWIGTPYVHRGSCKGGGTDCLGLVRGLWRELLGEEPEAPPAYSPDWDEVERDEALWRAARRHLIELPVEILSDGDIVLMRMVSGGVAKHLGVRATSRHGYATLIHAYSGHGVVESPLSPSWSKRIVAAFRLPMEKS